MVSVQIKNIHTGVKYATICTSQRTDANEELTKETIVKDSGLSTKKNK